jgi:hypothetical protein
MKKVLLLSLFLSLVLFAQYSRAQGLENFNNFGGTSNVYSDSTFLGQDGSTWTYFQCRGDSVIVAPTPTLGKARPVTAEITSGSIAGGCGTMSFQFKQVFSTNVSLDVYVNGLLVKTVTSSGEQGVVKNTGDIVVNTPGSVIFDFKQSSTASGQVAIDNITWTGYTGGPLPEPTEYPTLFTAIPGGYRVTLTWTDAAGAQAPTAYLIKASNANNITNPVDGTPVADDPNLADGAAVVNILQGVQTITFTGLPTNIPYYFKIFPYTNTGTLIDYKTDGTVPSATATTPNLSILIKTNFDDYTLGGWIAYSVTGDQVWAIDSTHGYSLPACAKMSGYAGGNFDNEDWLISPALDFDHSTNEVLSFMSAYKYTGNPMELKISTDYDGTSNPNTATWTALTAVWSPGNYTYTASGDIDVCAYAGANVRVAFKYTSTTAASSTWELDDIMVAGIRPVGVAEKSPNEINIYPNPAHGLVNVKFSTPETHQIEVYSILGNSVYRATTDRTRTQIDLSGVTSGVYFIKVTDANGTTATVQKLIVQ